MPPVRYNNIIIANTSAACRRTRPPHEPSLRLDYRAAYPTTRRVRARHNARATRVILIVVLYCNNMDIVQYRNRVRCDFRPAGRSCCESITSRPVSVRKHGPSERRFFNGSFRLFAFFLSFRAAFSRNVHHGRTFRRSSRAKCLSLGNPILFRAAKRRVFSDREEKRVAANPP